MQSLEGTVFLNEVLRVAWGKLRVCGVVDIEVRVYPLIPVRIDVLPHSVEGVDEIVVEGNVKGGSRIQ